MLHFVHIVPDNLDPCTRRQLTSELSISSGEQKKLFLKPITTITGVSVLVA